MVIDLRSLLRRPESSQNLQILWASTKRASLTWSYEEDGGDEGPRVDAGRRLGGVVHDGDEGPVDVLER